MVPNLFFPESRIVFFIDYTSSATSVGGSDIQPSNMGRQPSRFSLKNRKSVEYSRDHSQAHYCYFEAGPGAARSFLLIAQHTIGTR